MQVGEICFKWDGYITIPILLSSNWRKFTFTAYSTIYIVELMDKRTWAACEQDRDVMNRQDKKMSDGWLHDHAIDDSEVLENMTKHHISYEYSILPDALNT